MSAFICGSDHIDALLTFAINNKASFLAPITGNRIEFTEDNASDLGRQLMAENERSIAARYGEDDVADMAGDDRAAAYVFREWHLPLTAVAVLKGCDCFDYQACETDDYQQSAAYAMIDGIRARAISRVPGYSDAPGWEFRRPEGYKQPNIIKLSSLLGGRA